MIRQSASIDASKLIIFIITFLPIVIFGVGVLPFIFLISGLVMMKKDGDIEHLDSAYKYALCSFILVAIVVSCLTLKSWLEYTDHRESKNESDIAFEASLSPSDSLFKRKVDYEKLKSRMRLDDTFDNVKSKLTWVSVSIFYLFSLHYLFYTPLKKHPQWVKKIGIPWRSKNLKSQSANTAHIDIVKGGNLSPYSVADELHKWVSLKENGHISQNEYDEARKKLLNSK